MQLGHTDFLACWVAYQQCYPCCRMHVVVQIVEPAKQALVVLHAAQQNGVYAITGLQENQCYRRENMSKECVPVGGAACASSSCIVSS